jgi:hypothetical protein
MTVEELTELFAKRDAELAAQNAARYAVEIADFPKGYSAKKW